jgi:hypothetical protein
MMLFKLMQEQSMKDPGFSWAPRNHFDASTADPKATVENSSPSDLLVGTMPASRAAFSAVPLCVS